MALEWIVLSSVAAAEAIMLLLLTLPGLGHMRTAVAALSGSLLKPFLTVIPFSLFLLLDIYWKHETRPSCTNPESCTWAELVKYEKSVVKSQRNGLLIATALILYWMVYAVTHLVNQMGLLDKRVEKLKNEE